MKCPSPGLHRHWTRQQRAIEGLQYRSTLHANKRGPYTEPRERERGGLVLAAPWGWGSTGPKPIFAAPKTDNGSLANNQREKVVGVGWGWGEDCCWLAAPGRRGKIFLSLTTTTHPQLHITPPKATLIPDPADGVVSSSSTRHFHRLESERVLRPRFPTPPGANSFSSQHSSVQDSGIIGILVVSVVIPTLLPFLTPAFQQPATNNTEVECVTKPYHHPPTWNKL